jgi:heme-degrading monooxygenase HmoA
VPRISVFGGAARDEAFVKAWRERRAATGARLYRSHAPAAEFGSAEIAPDEAPRPDLPGTVASAVYRPVVTDLPDGATGQLMWINLYELPPEEDDGFVEQWTHVRGTVSGRPGYIGSVLSRSDDPDATFRWVNVSPWTDIDDFTAAVATSAFAEAATAIYHQAHPGLYELVS